MGFFTETGIARQPLKGRDSKQMILTKFGFVKQKPQEAKDNKVAYQFAKKSAQNKNGVDQSILASYSSNPEDFLQRADKRRGRQ